MSITYAEQRDETIRPPAEPPVEEPDPLGRPMATDAEARALASTLRMRILRVCLGEPRSNKEIAEALGKDPATTLHHVRRLVDTGFLAAQPVRRGVRGSREIPYLATGKSWRIQTPSKDRVIIDAFHRGGCRSSRPKRSGRPASGCG